MTKAIWQGLAAQEENTDIVVLASPEVTVTRLTDNSQPQVHSDRAGNNALGNPFTANADGSIEFYADPGRYKVEASKDGDTVTWDNVLIGAGIAGRRVLEDAVTATASGSPADQYEADMGADVADGAVNAIYFDSANTTTTPSLENTGGSPTGGKTITTKDGSALWADALDGWHLIERDGTADTWLVLYPGPANSEPLVGESVFLRGHIDGLELSNNGTDSDHDIDVATGVCSMRDGSGNRKLFELTSSLTKQIDVDWVEGTGNGGFPSGLTLAADTEYNFFVIGKDDGTVDAGFDTDGSASNLLTDASTFSWFRRIGSVITDGSSNILGFSQTDDVFTLDAISNDVSNSNPGTSAVTTALTAAADQRAILTAEVADTSPSRVIALLVSPTSSNDEAPSAGANSTRSPNINDSAAASVGTANLEMPLNGSSQLRFRVSTSDADVTVRILTRGWIDDRGRNA